MGYIRAVGDLVAAYELNDTIYRQTPAGARDTHMEYEKIEYGTNTRPGGLVRNTDGEYFAFESDRNGLLLNVSTSLSLPECLEQFQKAFPHAVARPGERASGLAIVAEGHPNHSVISHGGPGGEGLVEYSFDPSVLMADMPTDEAIELVRRDELEVVAARVAFKGFFMTWHRPYARFIDSDLEVAEAGVYAGTLREIDGMRRFMRLSGRAAFFLETDVTVRVREHGNPRQVRI